MMKNLSSLKTVFIGAGNMAEALVAGMIREGLCNPAQITVTDVLQERLDLFASKFGVAVSRDNAAAEGADIAVLAVKPQQMPAVLEALRPSAEKIGQTLFISIAAGIPTSGIEAGLGKGSRVVRAMPNTPALAGKGAAAICTGKYADEDDLELADILLGAVGLVVRAQEDDMDAVTAVSGSGPAYVFYLIEAMQQAAKNMGLDPEVSRDLVLATVEGAAVLCRETGLGADELRLRVTSKGGTTAAAMDVLEERKVFAALLDAMTAARNRAHELSEQN
ncbi:MAG TPA: pyrroline-5-carboxylate reductase [Kiritimatiellia bacterium]|nr:pyrroline-5-carboxylate reductase [Kiritimatiellia bacterium]HNS81547.1 pyrroline-5-carboxylate reductase [Kiritimatiellia bacterium]HPA78292.1 pyrroline-5-carboxylate reductase [Kiritimatiellia bacterium]HQQ05155.1 pyrroline-5-carboxylate reductase [Kiritimatiellia bacterium]